MGKGPGECVSASGSKQQVSPHSPESIHTQPSFLLFLKAVLCWRSLLSLMTEQGNLVTPISKGLTW